MRGMSRPSPLLLRYPARHPSVTQTFYLSPSVYSCCTGNLCVFLDLQQDQYISVSTSALSTVAARIQGLSLSHRFPASDAHFCDSDSDTLLNDLCAAHLITLTNSCNSRFNCNEIPNPDDDLTSTCSPRARLRGAPHILPLVRALFLAHLKLSRQPIAQIVETVKRRKREHPVAIGSDDIHRTLALAHRFSRYRFLYPKDYLCLFDSLALLLYLAHYNLHPTWVFGVREAPFFAHCWVQAGSIVLNDYRDKVTCYTPIMAI